ncbi:hypothetical protein C2845_PM10G12270 [Panicum miliaceum]|uniref:Uncharacterized protein n=1 Tax=Panicum miliaceum TaxID=4540 RepID=A0A3L6PHS2_PANMI|nr:hypothetical protein C2845_PM10G12270 [Panicum miliaceum]
MVAQVHGAGSATDRRQAGIPEYGAALVQLHRSARRQRALHELVTSSSLVPSASLGSISAAAAPSPPADGWHSCGEASAMATHQPAYAHGNASNLLNGMK